MTRLTGNHGRLLKKITAGGLAALLLVAGLPTPVAAQSCQGWKTAKFFETATADEVRDCLSIGRDLNEPDAQGLTALHRASRDTSDPTVIEALLDADANPRTYSIAGRLPWDFARKNKQIKGSDAYQRLRVESAKKADWARVQAMPHHRETVVLLYQDAAPRESRRTKGRFESATDNSITLRLEDGQTRTFPKQAVRKVRTWRPVKERKTGWVALVIGAVIAELLMNIDAPPSVLNRLLGHALLTLPIAGVSFYGSRMGLIYDVSRKHRMLPQGDQQSGEQSNTSGKQKDLGRLAADVQL